MASDLVQAFTDDNFEEEVLQSDIPVLVDFWAEWCGPCRMISPTVAEIAESHAEKLKVGKVNVDECPNTATKFGIQSIPTLLLFAGGELKESVIGVVPKAQIIEKVKPHITTG